MENSAEVQGANKGLLEHNFLQSERLYNGDQQRGFYQKTKAQGGFKDDVFSKEMHFLKVQNILAPYFLVKNL